MYKECNNNNNNYIMFTSFCKLKYSKNMFVSQRLKDEINFYKIFDQVTYLCVTLFRSDGV